MGLELKFKSWFMLSVCSHHCPNYWTDPMYKLNEVSSLITINSGLTILSTVGHLIISYPVNSRVPFVSLFLSQPPSV